jgi:hypothetical protein
VRDPASSVLVVDQEVSWQKEGNRRSARSIKRDELNTPESASRSSISDHNSPIVVESKSKRHVSYLSGVHWIGRECSSSNSPKKKRGVGEGEPEKSIVAHCWSDGGGVVCEAS